MSEASLETRASELISDPDACQTELTQYVENLVKDLRKITDKGNQAAATRVRKQLMVLKKFADASRKEVQKRVVQIKSERKNKK